MKLYLYILISVGLSCASSSKSITKLSSEKIINKEDRIETLNKEIRLFSEILDAEFDLFNVNGFKSQQSQGIPGATSLDYKVAIKVNTIHISKWIKDMVKIDSSENYNKWPNEIIRGRKQNWEINSKPYFYKRPGSNTMIIIYQNEGIIFKRIIID